MTEEQTPDIEERAPSSEILDELHSLGQQLTTAVKSLWESEDSRKLRQEIGDGFVELGQQVETAIETARESEAAKQFSEQVKETVDKARESDLAGKLEEGLTTGLRQLNQQLSQVARSFEAPKKAEGTPAGDAPEEGAPEE